MKCNPFSRPSAGSIRIFLQQHGNQRNTDTMGKLPLNMTPFVPFDGLPALNKVDQTMMRRLTELADRRGCSVEHLIHKALEQWVAHQAEQSLETKLIRFPKRLRRTGRRLEF
jgi:hypothetical protein